MKAILFPVFTLLIIHSVFAQTAPVKRSIPVKRNIKIERIGKDSINLKLNDEYYLIEDSCSTIKRFSPYNFSIKKFSGKFKDISVADPNLVVSEGAYTTEGLKTGEFISRYLNGNLRSKGKFKNDKFNGKWELFYEDGKPRLVFEADSSGIKILNAWNEKAEKVVDEGNGRYKYLNGFIVWEGKLLDGKPDGKWVATRQYDRTNTEISSETFKNGIFKKGAGPLGSYNDASRLVLARETDMPFTNIEKLMASSVPCNGTARKKYTSAQYYQGVDAFNEIVKNLVRPFLASVDLRQYDDEILFEAEVNESGRLGKFTHSKPFNLEIAFGLERELRKLPQLEPALENGVPIKQKMVITFKFFSGMYSFSYRFLRPGA